MRDGARFGCRTDRIQLHRDQFPNSTRVGVAVIQEVYLVILVSVVACEDSRE